MTIFKRFRVIGRPVAATMLLGRRYRRTGRHARS